MNKNNALRGLLVLAGLSLSSLALAHGDVTPRQWTPRDSSRWARNGATPTPTASPTPSTTSPSRSAPPPTTRTARAATAWKPSPAASPRTCACWRPAPRATNGSGAGHQRRGARWRGVHAEDGRLHQPGRPLGDPQLSGKRARRRVTRPTFRRRPRRPCTSPPRHGGTTTQESFAMIYAAPGTPVPSSPSSLATATTSAASSCLRSRASTSPTPRR